MVPMPGCNYFIGVTGLLTVCTGLVMVQAEDFSIYSYVRKIICIYKTTISQKFKIIQRRTAHHHVGLSREERDDSKVTDATND
jgi:hypothetical protein